MLKNNALKSAFKEVYAKTPKIVKKTEKKKGKAAADRQKVAIALNKARAKGARISKK